MKFTILPIILASAASALPSPSSLEKRDPTGECKIYQYNQKRPYAEWEIKMVNWGPNGRQALVDALHQQCGWGSITSIWDRVTDDGFPMENFITYTWPPDRCVENAIWIGSGNSGGGVGNAGGINCRFAN